MWKATSVTKGLFSTPTVKRNEKLLYGERYTYEIYVLIKVLNTLSKIYVTLEEAYIIKYERTYLSIVMLDLGF